MDTRGGFGFAAVVLSAAFILYIGAETAGAITLPASFYGPMVSNVYHQYPEARNLTLYNQDGALWFVYANNGSITCQFTPYEIYGLGMTAHVSWVINGTINSTANYVAFPVLNATNYTVNVTSGNFTAGETWDCNVSVEDAVGFGPPASSAPLYTITVLPAVPISLPSSMHLALFVLFLAVALICVALDIYMDVPYLGVLGGVLFILMGTIMSMDLVEVNRVFCEPGYNYTISCISKNVTIEPTMNAGLGAMLWVIGIGIILDAALMDAARAKREEL